MTTTLQREPRGRREVLVHAEGQDTAVRLPVQPVMPAHLIDGGEIVHLAMKPSPWFVVLESLRWLATALVIAVVSGSEWVPSWYKWYLYRIAFFIALARLFWAILEWVSRWYILTNRRFMRIRGVFRVDVFECALERIQNTYLTFSVPERLTRVGTITVETAGRGGGVASWRFVARPLEAHETLRSAIRRAQNRGQNGL